MSVSSPTPVVDPNSAPPKLLLSQREAAAALSISVRSFQRLNVKPIRLGTCSRPLYSVESLKALIPQA